MKRFAFGVLICAFVLGAFAVSGNLGFAAEADAPAGVVERTLFATNGENSVRVCYDSYTWETYPTDTEKENWKWYSEEEFAAHIEHLQFQKDGGRDPDWGKCCGIYSSIVDSSTNGAERNFTKLNQTLTDIKNGIKVSKPKTIFITRDAHDTGALVGWAQWYCYSYTVKDRTGKEVDLGPFETRDELFSALRQHYDRRNRPARRPWRICRDWLSRLQRSP